MSEMTADSESLRDSAEKSEKFLQFRDWAAFWVSFVVALAVYFWALPPTVTLEDSGELAVAGDYLGVPHPPGYPIWTMLAWFFARVFSFVPYRGNPNPAWAIALLSAVFGALASGTAAMLVSRSGAYLLDSLIPSRRSEDEGSDANDAKKKREYSWICWAAGVSSSLLFAFSPVMWSQAVIIEVYSLNAFFLVLILLLSFQWMWRPSNNVLYATAFIFGLGLTNYQVLLLVIVALVFVIMLRDLALFRDLALSGIAMGIFVVMLKLASSGNLIGFGKWSVAENPINGSTAAIVMILCVGAALALMATRRKLLPAGPAAAVYSIALLVATFMCLAIKGAADPQLPPGQVEETFAWMKWLGAFGLAFVGMLALSFSNRKALTFTAIVFAFALPMAILLQKGALLSLIHPTSGWFWFYVALNFVVLTLIFMYVPRGRVVAFAILAAQAGVGVYIYMPIVSDLRNPPMNWGHPLTWEGFKHALTRGQYEKIAPSDIFSARYVEQLGVYLTDLRRQFTLLFAGLGFLPFTLWGFNTQKMRFQAFYVATAISALAVVFVILDAIIPGLAASAAFVALYKALFFAVVLIAVPGVVLMLHSIMQDYWGRLTSDDDGQALSERITAAVPILAAAGGYLLLILMLGRKLFEDGSSLGFGGAFFLLGGMIGPGVLYAFVAYLTTQFRSLRPEVNATSQRWILATLIGFLVMSLLLISLANLKMDLQDTFIQRVKFISSHAYFALWVGYGLIFALLLVERLVHRVKDFGKPLGALAIVAVLLFPIVPIHENFRNEGLIREMGGAEMTDHDFGWQFGYYQLRGANGITEELEADEEPVPNPEFPPEMDRDSIFYGGTDPGRFVPTYMIYSGHVREDVYLITQNALADNTFMSVTRDLYGDQIWIPSSRDNASAFGRYVEDVRSGRRKPNAALSIRDGKVSVQGVEGVMIINGILAKMIFDHNIFRHSFYVEESYVIQWMYPYLIPNGLIMQIAPEPFARLTPEMVRNDMDFWDWYVRRLTSDDGFHRDVVARKSFSKLRSAIAGLYAHRQLWKEAELAFHDALMLYPLSPEANFRLCGNVYLRLGRFDDARRFMTDFQDLDPNNNRVPGFIGQINGAEQTRKRMLELQQILQKGTSDPAPAIELMRLYISIGQQGLAKNLADNLLGNQNIPAQTAFTVGQIWFDAKNVNAMHDAFQICLQRAGDQLDPRNILMMAQMYANSGQIPGADQMLELYLARQPNDFNVRVERAAMLLAIKKPNEALTELEQAVRFGGNAARGAIGQHPRLGTLRQTPRYQALMQPQVATPNFGTGGIGSFGIPRRQP